MCPHHVRSLAFINLFHGFSSSPLLQIWVARLVALFGIALGVHRNFRQIYHFWMTLIKLLKIVWFGSCNEFILVSSSSGTGHGTLVVLFLPFRHFLGMVWFYSQPAAHPKNWFNSSTPRQKSRLSERTLKLSRRSWSTVFPLSMPFHQSWDCFPTLFLKTSIWTIVAWYSPLPSRLLR